MKTEPKAITAGSAEQIISAALRRYAVHANELALLYPANNPAGTDAAHEAALATVLSQNTPMWINRTVLRTAINTPAFLAEHKDHFDAILAEGVTA